MQHYRNRFPSVATIERGLNVDRATAVEIRKVMDGRRVEKPLTRMQLIDKLYQTHGVEYQPRGRNEKSPAFYYCNAGDSYAATVVKINGRFRICCWGDIVERGNYD